MCVTEILKTSIGKKQVVATTGLLLIIFVIGHLAGNLLIFLGPDVFNAYAKKLASLRPGLYLIEIALTAVFLIHIWVTALLVLQNIKARPVLYEKYADQGNRSLATRLMPYTGTLLFAFIIWHLMDFTFIDKHGPRSVLPDGVSYGLYGVVLNSFSNSFNSAFYITAMASLGFHLAHGVGSFMQTFGFNHPKFTPLINRISVFLGVLVAVGFSSIPLFALYKIQTYY